MALMVPTLLGCDCSLEELVLVSTSRARALSRGGHSVPRRSRSRRGALEVKVFCGRHHSFQVDEKVFEAVNHSKRSFRNCARERRSGSLQPALKH